MGDAWRAAVATTAILALAAIAVPGALASSQRAKFKLTVEGEQTNTWIQDYVIEGQETVACHSEGSEHVSFATARPIKVTVKMGGRKAPKDFLWFAFGPGGPAGWGDPGLTVKAEVERRSVRTGGEACVQSPADNCARSTQGVDWRLLLEGDPFERNRIELADDFSLDQPDPFPDCYAEGLAVFPEMFFEYSGVGEQTGVVTASLSERKVFKRAGKRLTAEGSGTEADPGLFAEDPTWTAGIDYTVSLKRVQRR